MRGQTSLIVRAFYPFMLRISPGLILAAARLVLNI